MEISREEAVRRYNMIRDELKSKCPEQWEVVVALCKALPERIDSAAVWRFGRDKPCYSNITVPIGKRVALDIGRSADFGHWQKIASEDWAITMRKRGRSWKSNGNFKIEGRAADVFVSKLERGGLRSYLWRLYSIRELALALENESLGPCLRTLVECVDAYGELPIERVKEWTKQFGHLAGLGWGHTTAYHMLTDLGVAVKPDIHLTKSLVRMGLLAPVLPSDAPQEEFRNEKAQHSAAKSAMKLSKWITPTAHPGNPRCAMREVDKVLMEWSRQGMAQPL